MPKRSRRVSDEPIMGLAPAAQRWLNDYSKVSAWMQRYDIPKLLRSGGGLVRIPNFLPEHIADAILKMLESRPESDWVMTEAREDYAANNISHAFWSTKRGRDLELVTRAFTLLQPGRFHTFSAAKYCHSHHIAPHDDRAYSQVLMDDGQLVACSRDIAVIYYLTKDWKEQYGGALVDLEGGKTYVPMYNSAVVFQVPRYHQVTAMTVDRPRYSVFGWFLEPGVQYELYTGEEEERRTQAAVDKHNARGSGGKEGAKNSTEQAQAALKGSGQQGLGGQDLVHEGIKAPVKAESGSAAANGLGLHGQLVRGDEQGQEHGEERGMQEQPGTANGVGDGKGEGECGAGGPLRPRPRPWGRNRGRLLAAQALSLFRPRGASGTAGAGRMRKGERGAAGEGASSVVKRQRLG